MSYAIFFFQGIKPVDSWLAANVHVSITSICSCNGGSNPCLVIESKDGNKDTLKPLSNPFYSFNPRSLRHKTKTLKRKKKTLPIFFHIKIFQKYRNYRVDTYSRRGLNEHSQQFLSIYLKIRAPGVDSG